MLTNEELEAIRERIKDREMGDVLHVSDRAQLFAEVDRLRRLDALAREWLRAEEVKNVLEQDHRNSSLSAALESYQSVAKARVAYRRAVEGEGK